jgi:hypothetical protein
MFKCITNSVRSGRRSWLKVAVVTGLLLSTVSTPANAYWGQTLYDDTYYVSVVSTNNNYVYLKSTSYFQPLTGYVTIAYDAWKGGPYNGAIYTWLIDQYGNVVGYAVHHGTPNNPTTYSHVFYATPGVYCYLLTYVTDPQTQPNWAISNDTYVAYDGAFDIGISF